ncbi:MAG: ShlB/FhaC/HecB family hemolysin secretion/activation protein [Chthoniobacteraceae bacterium]|jgi:hemolysin activation/secretion protein
MLRLHIVAARMRPLAGGALLCTLATGPYAWGAAANGSNGTEPPNRPAAAASPTPAQQEFYIREYRVRGAHHLQPIEIEEAVYPFLGPGRTIQDVEDARQALMKVYQDKNYSSVQVVVPPQNGAGGIVYIQVNELAVGRLRVHGSRYYDINEIKREVPSLAEGKLIDFTEAQKELVGLNQMPDRRVTPVIQAGVLPNTMDVDLNVQDTLPLHGSLELNNRYSADSPSLRLNGSISYDNLWQLGHSIGGSFQISPQNWSKVAVYTGFYTMRIPDVDWLTFTLQGTKQNSNVSTLGALDVAGRGDVLGVRANFKLPTMGDYLESFIFGIDYKEFDQAVRVGAATTATETPTTYVPLTFDYSGTWVGKQYLTDLDIQVVLGIRGIGSNSTQFINNRFDADRNFIYLRGELSHTQDLPYDLQLFGKVAGQVSDSPLINSEQYSLGGLGTVRGYLESEVLADDAAVFNFEFRSPSLLGWLRSADKTGNDWRFYFFTDAATGSIQDSLPEQTVRYSLASYGGGTRMTLLNHFNGSLDVAVPLFNQANTRAHSPFLTFRIWTDF